MLYYQVIVSVIGTVQLFEQFYLMPGPGFSTRTLVFEIWTHGFRDLDYGFASAQAVLLTAVIAIISVFQFRYLSSDVEY